jgi:poly-gamma-glutamate capsule biosynthesis protein CapA/YwtB (metallophosphatase superfamily)
VADRSVTLFLSGDVMLGRGVDQVLAHPADPELREQVVLDARTYVRLAEEANGPIPRPLAPSAPWGDLLAVLDAAAPDARIVNLETSVTADGDFAPGKPVCYRVHPANLPCLVAVRPDVCVLANNHVLDFGPRGLTDTLGAMAAAGLRVAGAGADEDAAWAPSVVPLGGGRRLVVTAFGTPSSGIPAGWAAAGRRGGVAYLDHLTDAAADRVLARVAAVRRPGDVVVASVHWGSNWGWPAPPEQAPFAARLVEGGVDVVHGHSSHHPRPVELHRGRLVLHGCGDLVDDYEGIGGHEHYRPDVRAAWLATLGPDGDLTELRATVLRARRMRLERAPPSDATWLADRLARAGGRRALRLQPTPDGELVGRPGQAAL